MTKRIDIEALQSELRTFAVERDWEKYHSPKNLVMALTAEVGELVDHFQWLTPDESFLKSADGTTRREVEHELADVMIYLARLIDVLDIDIDRAVRGKLSLNAERFPRLQSEGSE